MRSQYHEQRKSSTVKFEANEENRSVNESLHYVLFSISKIHTASHTILTNIEKYSYLLV